MLTIQRIVVPTDFSEHAEKALDLAIEFARAFGAHICLVHCYEINPGAISPYGIAMPAGLDREIREAAQSRLEALREKVAAAGVEVTTRLESLAPSLGIFEAVDEVDADLIVMGTRGLSGVKHVLMGSIAERTVRLARCPVLVVHADGKHSQAN